METQTNRPINRKALGLIVLIVLIVAAALYLYKYKSTSIEPDDTEMLEVVKTEVAKDKFPLIFPSNIPSEEGSEIINNYNSSIDDGRFQATRTYTTKKSLAENFAIYNNYMKVNGWEINATVDDEQAKFISGQKDNQHMQVTIDENSISKDKTVSISITELN